MARDNLMPTMHSNECLKGGCVCGGDARYYREEAEKLRAEALRCVGRMGEIVQEVHALEIEWRACLKRSQSHLASADTALRRAQERGDVDERRFRAAQRLVSEMRGAACV